MSLRIVFILRWSLYVAQVDLKFIILLPQSPQLLKLQVCATILSSICWMFVIFQWLLSSLDIKSSRVSSAHNTSDPSGVGFPYTNHPPACQVLTRCPPVQV